MKWEVTLRRVLADEVEFKIVADTEAEACALAEEQYWDGDYDDHDWRWVESDVECQARLCRQAGEKEGE